MVAGISWGEGAGGVHRTGEHIPCRGGARSGAQRGRSFRCTEGALVQGGADPVPATSPAARRTTLIFLVDSSRRTRRGCR